MSYYGSKDYWRKRKIAVSQAKQLNADLKPMQTGIYTWIRVKEYCVYVGQAKDILERTISHLQAYDHLGNSVRNHGIYSKKNPYGWRLTYEICNKEDLDSLERKRIAECLEKGFTMINITSGGQNAGKVDINQRESGKNYRDGLKQGYANAIKEIAELVNKYLVVMPRNDDRKKDGEIKEIYLRKHKEFEEKLKSIL